MRSFSVLACLIGIALSVSVDRRAEAQVLDEIFDRALCAAISETLAEKALSDVERELFISAFEEYLTFTVSFFRRYRASDGYSKTDDRLINSMLDGVVDKNKSPEFMAGYLYRQALLLEKYNDAFRKATANTWFQVSRDTFDGRQCERFIRK